MKKELLYLHVAVPLPLMRQLRQASTFAETDSFSAWVRATLRREADRLVKKHAPRKDESLAVRR